MAPHFYLLLALAALVFPAQSLALDLTGGRLARFVDRPGTAWDTAKVEFASEAAITAPLPDPTTELSTLRIFSDITDTCPVTLDPAGWRRTDAGFVYALPRRWSRPGGISHVLFESGPEGGRLEFRARGHGYGQHAITGPVQYVQVEFAVGETTYSGRFVSPPAEVVSNVAHRVELRGDGVSIPVQQVGHEVIEIADVSGFPFDIELVVWISQEITTEEYDALPLPRGWQRNEPRENVGQRSRFLRSPGGEADGEFTYRDMFGFTWLHNASVVSLNGPADPGGLLSSNTVEKHHELSWCPGSTITTLTSPQGLEYILVSRDARRTSDTPTIPSGWALEERVLDEELQVLLPTRTINLRADNEDSFQGPLSREVDIAVLPWRLRAEAGAPVHVAVFGSQDVDVEAVDIASIAFGPAGAMGTSADVEVRHLNDDDRVDLSLTFDYEDTGIPLGESEACLTGELAGGSIEGCTRVMACGHGFELAIILPPLLLARRGRRARSLRGSARPAPA